MKIWYARKKISSENYYSKRLKKELEIRGALDNYFDYHPQGGIIGDMVTGTVNVTYYHYALSIRPRLTQRILWYKKKINERK